jgi:hypothetical protein
MFDLTHHYKKTGNLYVLTDDVEQGSKVVQEIRSWNLDAIIDISRCQNSRYLCMGLAPVKFALNPFQEFTHYHQGVAHYSIGAVGDKTLVHGKKIERSIYIGSGLPLPIHYDFCCEFGIREVFELPPDGFLLCFPSSPGTVPKKQMCLWFTLLSKVPNSFLVLIPHPYESLESIWDALRQFNSEEGIYGSIFDKERILI